MSKHTFSIGGVHPHDNKISRACAIEPLPLAPTVYLSMSQHIGAPAKPVVAVGDKVKVGQVVAEPGGFVSAFIHSSVSGTVKSIGPRKDLAGNPQTCIEIAVEGDEWLEGIDTTDTLVTEIPADNKAILDKIRLGGVVGLGGATFPTHVKLSPPPGSKCERVIINGCECEPYLTSDFRTLLEKGEQVVVGAAILRQVMGNVPCTIAIEENKPEAIAHIQDVIKKLGYEGIEVMVMKMMYPQGGEKQLIDAVMHRQVGSGALPISVGAVVQNVATALAVYDAVQKNKPIVDNSVTVTGGREGHLRRSHDGPRRGEPRRRHGQGNRRPPAPHRERDPPRPGLRLHPLRQMCRRLPDGPGTVPAEPPRESERPGAAREERRPGLHRVRLLPVFLPGAHSAAGQHPDGQGCRPRRHPCPRRGRQGRR